MLPRPTVSRTASTRASSLRRSQKAGDRRAAVRRHQLDATASRAAAQRQLRRFRQGSALAVAITAMLLLVVAGPLGVESDAAPVRQDAPPAEAQLPADAVTEATGTLRQLAAAFYGMLPRLAIAALLMLVAVVVARLTRGVLERALGSWQRTAAVVAIARLAIFLVAGIAALSLIAGDARTLVGSVGLLGLAASWALQTPIESFTGWLLNSFRGYYRVGDRIAVGDVFGDVYRIDVLTTTLWEAGGPGKPVAAAQPTGALITLPNWEVLRSNIVNYTRDFPFVWDEITVNISDDSDLAYAMRVLEATARRVLGPEMVDAAKRYEQLLKSEQLPFEVEELPRVYLAAADSWTQCTIRYLVNARSRRATATALHLEIAAELARPEHRGRVRTGYPRRDVFMTSPPSPSPSETSS